MSVATAMMDAFKWQVLRDLTRLVQEQRQVARRLVEGPE